MGDVAQILGVTPQDRPSNNGPRKQSAVAKKPEGVSREVFSLLGQSSSLAPVMPTHERNWKASDMKLMGAKKAVPWEWTEFAHSGRSDDANFRMKHWQRKVMVLPDYVFARFNKKCAVVDYTDEEYEAAIAPNDMLWNKKTTDKLFEMCNKYDLRWYVIADRWGGDAPISTCDLRERYYAVAKEILQYRKRTKKPKAPESASNSPNAMEDGATQGKPSSQNTGTVSTKAIAEAENAILDYTFDVVAERTRLDQLNRLYSRTPAEEKEEAHCLNEIRKIDLQLRRLQNASKDSGLLSRTSKGSLHQFPSSLIDKIFNTEVSADEKGEIPLPAQSQHSAAVEMRSAGFYIPESSLGLGIGIQKKLNQLLAELDVLKFSTTGIPLPLVGTSSVVSAYDKLRQDIVKLFAIKTKIQKNINIKKKLQSGASAVSRTKTPKSENRKQSFSVPVPVAPSSLPTESQLPPVVEEEQAEVVDIPSPVHEETQSVVVKTEPPPDAVRTSGRKRVASSFLEDLKNEPTTSRASTKRKSVASAGSATKKKR